MIIGVLANPDSWYLRDLQRAAVGRCEIVPMAFDRMLAHVPSPIGGPPLSATGSTSAENANSVSTGGASGTQADSNVHDAILVRTMPPGSLEQVVFRMDALGQLEGAGTVVVNSARAVEACVDKYLATAKLAAAGLTVPRTFVCQTVDEAMVGFEELGRDVVLKPLFGGEGRGITRLTDENLALRAFKMLVQMQAVIYQQAFIEHEGFDIRLFVLGDDVLGMKRVNPDDWRTNVSRGAVTEPFEVDDHFRELALRSAGSVGGVMAGVDVLIGRDGRQYVLEVNAVPGWKALARTLDIDISVRVLRFLESLVRERKAG